MSYPHGSINFTRLLSSLQLSNPPWMSSAQPCHLQLSHLQGKREVPFWRHHPRTRTPTMDVSMVPYTIIWINLGDLLLLSIT